MPSSRQAPDPRRLMFLKLSSLIEAQLREAYARKHEKEGLSQSEIARILGVDRSAIHNRLSGKTNMTIETIADMVWALGHDVQVNIFDPCDFSPHSSYFAADSENDADLENFSIEASPRPHVEITS